MQVRNNLQTKKQQRLKNQKNQPFLLPPKKKNRNSFNKYQTNKSRSYSRSKSHSEKQNGKYKKLQSKSKSKQKVSPFKLKQISGLNTSPVPQSQRYHKNKKSPLKYQQKGTKNLYSHREYDPGVSTKLNTQRTPVKKNKDKSKGKKQKKQKSITNKKFVKQKNTERIEKIKRKQKLYDPQLQIDLKPQEGTTREDVFFRKIKKFIPPINTRGPQRKQSYFDQQILQKLNLDNAQFLRRKKNIHAKAQQAELLANNKQTIRQTDENRQIISTREYGTQTDHSLSFRNVIYKELQHFRKQQQLKWKIMYLELSQLRNNKTPEKIQEIIDESKKNISQFQIKCKEIIGPSKNQYVIQSPTKIRDALRKRRKSSIENHQLIKSLSDQKLLQELQILGNFEDLSHIKDQRQQQNSRKKFCLQLQQQLEHYSAENRIQDRQPTINAQIENIQWLQYEKSNEICQQIQQKILIQFCEELAQNQGMLHGYLLACKLKQQKMMPQFKQFVIQCSQTYSYNMLYNLFNFIDRNDYKHKLVQKINTPLGEHPLAILKTIRSSINEYSNQNQSQDSLKQQEVEGTKQILDGQMLNCFELQSYSQTMIQGQYFYNHCLYTCFNQIFDTLRPFGTSGKPSLSLSQSSYTLYKNAQQFFYRASKKLKQILQVKMGRIEFNDETDPIKAAEKSYSLLDRLIVHEEEEKWKKIQDQLLEEKYFLAELVIDFVFNEEFLIFYSQFL